MIILILNGIVCQTYNENTYFVNSAVLVEPDTYRVYWNFTNEDIIFKIVVKTTGWAGFGLSPNGGMKNSDLITVWGNASGSFKFVDGHVEDQPMLIQDSVQNWKCLYFSKLDSFMTVIFTRKLSICAKDQPINEINIDIAPTQYVIYSWGTTAQPTYHGAVNRGSKSLPLLAALNQNVRIDMSDVETIDFRVNVNINIYFN